jgi:hypothetical protein
MNDEDILSETLQALQMPREGLIRWFEQNARFCQRHGGSRYYAEWLTLYDECLTMLKERTDAP